MRRVAWSGWLGVGIQFQPTVNAFATTGIGCPAVANSERLYAAWTRKRANVEVSRNEKCYP